MIILVPLGIILAINIGILACWVYFLILISWSISKSPKLEWSARYRIKSKPMVSIIVPARNEGVAISKCLQSLLSQDYDNYEVIAVDDSSTDNTFSIISDLSKNNHTLTPIKCPPRPDDWVGKNWACFQGYKKSTGEILLFTDADTVHRPDVLSSAINTMMHDKIDALTLVPKLLCQDIITKFTLPVLSVFLHSRYSPLRVNNPNNKIGYFFGSFYLISKTNYEKIGTHEKVRRELVEDGALGRIVKEQGMNLRLVRGENYVEALWARDPRSLWHALRRIIIPLHTEKKKSAMMITAFIFFILMEPFLTLPLSLLYLSENPLKGPLEIVCLWTIILILICAIVQSRFGLLQKSIYGLGFVLGCTVITVSFLMAAFSLKGNRTVKWRDRSYLVGTKQHPFHL
ncbi:MAG: glycosyltransferase [Nitrososphaeraceae archaeon]|nr:glycosyltransferase [Nitrososphaeraceae archaeon]MDW0156117.1 glycosyltransferase [Nitrososphaeraceae archaeon]